MKYIHIYIYIYINNTRNGVARRGYSVPGIIPKSLCDFKLKLDRYTHAIIFPEVQIWWVWKELAARGLPYIQWERTQEEAINTHRSFQIWVLHRGPRELTWITNPIGVTFGPPRIYRKPGHQVAWVEGNGPQRLSVQQEHITTGGWHNGQSSSQDKDDMCHVYNDDCRKELHGQGEYKYFCCIMEGSIYIF